MKRPAPGSNDAHAHRQRRQHVRLDLRMSAEIRTKRSVFTATTRDLSVAGAGLDAERPLQEGEEVALGLFLVLDDVEIDTPPPLGQGPRGLDGRDGRGASLGRGALRSDHL